MCRRSFQLGDPIRAGKRSLFDDSVPLADDVGEVLDGRDQDHDYCESETGRYEVAVSPVRCDLGRSFLGRWHSRLQACGAFGLSCRSDPSGFLLFVLRAESWQSKQDKKGSDGERNSTNVTGSLHGSGDYRREVSGANLPGAACDLPGEGLAEPGDDLIGHVFMKTLLDDRLETLLEVVGVNAVGALIEMGPDPL